VTHQACVQAQDKMHLADIPSSRGVQRRGRWVSDLNGGTTGGCSRVDEIKSSVSQTEARSTVANPQMNERNHGT
jgi:hypothetical protein